MRTIAAPETMGLVVVLVVVLYLDLVLLLNKTTTLQPQRLVGRPASRRPCWRARHHQPRMAPPGPAGAPYPGHPTRRWARAEPEQGAPRLVGWPATINECRARCPRLLGPPRRARPPGPLLIIQSHTPNANALGQVRVAQVCSQRSRRRLAANPDARPTGLPLASSHVRWPNTFCLCPPALQRTSWLVGRPARTLRPRPVGAPTEARSVPRDATLLLFKSLAALASQPRPPPGRAKPDTSRPTSADNPHPAGSSC